MIEDRFRRDDDWSISESSLEPGEKLVASPYRKKLFLAIFLIMPVSFFVVYLWVEQKSLTFSANEVYKLQQEVVISQDKAKVATSQLDSALAEIQRLESDLDATKKEVVISQDTAEAATSQLDSALAEIQRLESDLDATKKEVVISQDTAEAATSQLDSALAEIQRLESDLDATKKEVVISQDTAEAATSQLDSALAETQRLESELTEYSPVESGTFTFLFGAPLAEGPLKTKTKLVSFPFTRSAAPVVNDEIISDTIVPVFRSYPTVKQLHNPKWKWKNLAGYLNPQTELLVLKVIEVDGTFWVEACIVAGEDCGN